MSEHKAMLLTDDDLFEVTGTRYGKIQEKRLIYMGFVKNRDFRVRPDGKPRMTWDAFNGLHLTQEPIKESPRLDLIHVKKRMKSTA